MRREKKVAWCSGGIPQKNLFMLKLFWGMIILSFDDVEHLLEGILAGLRARKEIEPLRKENSDLKEKISTAEKNFQKLSAEKNSLEKNFGDLKIERDNFCLFLESVFKISREQARLKLRLREFFFHSYVKNFSKMCP